LEWRRTGHSKETFTGWTDMPLSPKGVQEARATGRQVAQWCNSHDHFYFDFGGGGNIDV
jgi:bisphosphoglycerate-dependent phosphoglycerate mutase